MQQLNTKYAVENVMCCAISEWFETGHVPLDKYPEEFRDAIWSQARSNRVETSIQWTNFEIMAGAPR